MACWVTFEAADRSFGPRRMSFQEDEVGFSDAVEVRYGLFQSRDIVHRHVDPRRFAGS